MGGPKLAVGTMCAMCTCRYWYSWHFRLCLWEKVAAEEQGKWKSVSPKFILFSDEVVAAYFDWPIGTKDSTCVVEITAANFAAFLCFDLPNKLLIFASRFCNSCGYSQISAQNKCRCSLHVGTHSLELLLFSLIFSQVFGSLLSTGIAAGRREDWCTALIKWSFTGSKAWPNSKDRSFPVILMCYCYLLFFLWYRYCRYNF